MMNKITIYGIANCDTIKKTLDWYKKRNIPVVFHDFKKSGIATHKLAAWCQQVGWEILLNKKSTTWRSLPVATQQQLTGEAAAIELMQQNTSLIKRPVIELNDRVMVGFNEATFNELFN